MQHLEMDRPTEMQKCHYCCLFSEVQASASIPAYSLLPGKTMEGSTNSNSNKIPDVNIIWSSGFGSAY